MRTTTAVVTIVGALLGCWIGYDRAGVGGALLWAVLWGFGGFLIGRAIVSTATLASRFWKVALATVLVITAIVLTWGLRL